MGYGRCNNKTCDRQIECKRFLDEENVMYVRYENVYYGEKQFKKDGECPWFIQIPREVEVVEEKDEKSSN